MKTVLIVLMVACMAAVLVSLFGGLLNMVRTDHDPRRSNRFMRYRVVLQGAALLVFALLMTLYRSS